MLGLLAVVTLVLFVLEFAVSFDDPWDRLVLQAQIAVWTIFVVAFAIELVLAPSATGYLKKNWLVALSLVVPPLRILRVVHGFRVLRGARAVRSIQLIRASTVINRAAGVIREFFQFSRFAYLLMLMIVLSITSGVLVQWLEQTEPDANITNLQDGIWWAVTTVTTINSPLEPVTWEARVVALVLRIFGLTVVGYFTAVAAVFIIGHSKSTGAPARDDELSALRDEVQRLREAIERRESAP